MRLLKAKQDNPKKIVIEISKLTHIKSMTPLPELLNGEDMQNPIEVRQHSYSLTPRKGVGGKAYEEKRYSVFRGSQRVKAAIELGYTHIEGVIIND